MPLLVGFGIAVVVSLICCFLVVYLTESWLPQWIAHFRYKRSQQLELRDLFLFTDLRTRLLEDVVADLVTRTPYWVNTESELICRVAAGFVVVGESFLVVNLLDGPLAGFWGLPSGYLKWQSGVEPLEIARETVLRQIGEWCSDQDPASWLTDSGKWWSKKFVWPIESRFLATELIVLRFEADSQSRIASNTNVKWCTADETLRLPGKIHPLLSDVLKEEFNEPSLADKLLAKTYDEVRHPSEWRQWAEQVTSTMFKNRQKKDFMDRLLHEKLTATPQESLKEDQLRDLAESLAVNVYDEDFIKYVMQYKQQR